MASFPFFDKEYVLRKLSEHGVEHLIPGDFRLTEYREVLRGYISEDKYPNQTVIAIRDDDTMLYMEFHKETGDLVTVMELRFLTEEEQEARCIIKRGDRYRSSFPHPDIDHVDLFKSVVVFKDKSKSPRPVEVFIRPGYDIRGLWPESMCQDIEPFNLWKHVDFQDRYFKDLENLPSNDAELSNEELEQYILELTEDALLDKDHPRVAWGRFNIVSDACEIGNGWHILQGSHIPYEQFTAMWKHYPETDSYKLVFLMLGYFCPNEIMGVDENFQVLEWASGEPVVTELFRNHDHRENKSILLAHAAGTYPCLKEVVERVRAT